METETIIALVLAAISLFGCIALGVNAYLNQPEEVDLSGIIDNSKEINALQEDLKDLQDDFEDMPDLEITQDDLDELIDDIDDNHDNIRDVIKCLKKFDSNSTAFEECIEKEF